MPLRIAHRGMPRRIRENTLPGFALALEEGADGIELDVHATADGTIVVHHDPVLPDGSAIAALTLDGLRRHEAAAGIGIPTLAETCALVAGRGALFVEIKGEGIEQGVVDTLEKYRGDVAIHGFDHAQIGRLHESGCPIPLGVLFEDGLERLDAVLRATGARDVWPRHALVTRALVDEVHLRGGRVIPWTVNDPQCAMSLVAMGVDGICGDDVTVLPA